MLISQRLVCALVLSAAAAACGGDSTAPEPPPPFPAVSGSYRFDITFTGFPSSLANGTGTVTFTQPNRETGVLSATGAIQVLIGTSNITVTQMQNATVTESGAIRLQMIPPNTSTTWGFDGQLTGGGSGMTGTHVLVGTTSSFPGSWTATRQ